MTSNRGPVGMVLIGSAELAIGGALLAAALFDLAPAARTVLFIIGIILFVTGALFLLIGLGLRGHAAAAQRLRATGVPGRAQVLAARPTGTYVNNQPQVQLELRVSTAVHGTFDVTVKVFVPLTATGRLSDGRPLAVTVDPTDRQRILVDWSGTSPPPDAALRDHLLRTGVPATARVLGASFTGQLDERGHPVYDVQLHLEVDGRAPVAGPGRFAVPPQRTATMQPGGVIPVRVDPHDSTTMAADWDRLPA
ncbi:hypothetical protein Dvina_31870 [Dactylosporangium vinaceum]|uniref:Uncharacterized protein n=1 Tax=Dactylosporangium vinaceum TaxID=53362 RepID=A0ABV5MAR4_9ACTN|nr:hypothetical protein [Dactylosporangium vinaceum]UAB92894.1 hypothetical protein Dvina_31870 [Dactylosporangium vinaceum]